MTYINDFGVPELDADGLFYVEKLSTLIEYAKSKGWNPDRVVVAHGGDPYLPSFIWMMADDFPPGDT